MFMVKEKKSNKKLLIICSVIGVLLLAGMGFIIYSFCIPRFNIKEFNGVVSMEYNGKFSLDNVCYGNIFECDTITPEIVGEYDMNKVGTYEVKYVFEYKGHSYEMDGVLNVVDKEAPEITVAEGELELCPNEDKLSKGSITAEDKYDGDVSSKITYSYDTEKNKLIVTVTDNSGNKLEKELDGTKGDTVGPVITITGDASISVLNGSTYTDQGATASDNCDGELQVEVDNPVNTGKNGTYTVTYTAKDSTGNVTTATRTVKVYTKSSSSGTSYSCEGKVKYSCGGSGKVIYLTFDDGPSGYTSQLLDVLKQYNVKATFFVTGNGSDAMIKREYDEGHTVALHSQTHSYATIYASVDAYFNDLQQISDRVERITGHKSYIVRFPGGSSNTVSRKSKCIMTTLAHELENRGYAYYDWNVSSGDAGATTDTNQVYENVVSRLGNSRYVVLQHDSKGYSVKAVERIIQYGLDHGYTFERLEKDSMVCHHATAN